MLYKEINAAVLVKKKSALYLKKIEFFGPLKKGQVLVKILYSGICGKQIDEIDGVGEVDKYLPHCLGHEGSGLVLDIGAGVKKVKKGQKVILHWIKGIGINSEVPNYYEKKTSKKINAGWVTTFNDFAVVSENRLSSISSKINIKDAALFGCAVPTGIGTILNYQNFNLKDKKEAIAIVGCGGVGLLMIQALKIIKKKNIIAIDIKPTALQLAKKCGAKETLLMKNQKSFQKKILKITNNKGVDHVFVNTGNKNAIQQALKILSKKSRLVQVGVPSLKMSIKVNLFDVLHGKQISGCMGGDTVPEKHMKKYIKLYQEKKIKLNMIVSKIFPFKKINKAIEYHRRSSGRVLLKF
jgi:S-(hydroxymethyl)glutathione dehydrogenase/alcohol dehydrogenase